MYAAIILKGDRNNILPFIFFASCQPIVLSFVLGTLYSLVTVCFTFSTIVCHLHAFSYPMKEMSLTTRSVRR